MAGYRAGELIRGRYQIVESLGVGRIGTVVQALDQDVGIEVAFKVIHPALLPDREMRDQFITSARELMRIKHKTSARVFAVDRDEDDRCFIARQLIGGRSMREEVERRAREGLSFSKDEVIEVVEQVVDLLSGDQVIVHGSLTPRKIWLLPKQAKVVDVGVSQYLTPAALWHRLRSSVRDRGHVAPEIGWGRLPGPRADVFALGAMVGEMLTMIAADGRPEAFVEADPDLDPAFDAVIRRAMDGEPANRFQTVGDLLVALGEARDGVQPAPAPSTAPAPRDTLVEASAPAPRDTLVESAASEERGEDTLRTPAPHSRKTPVVGDIFDDTAQVSMEAVIRAHTGDEAEAPEVKPVSSSEERATITPPKRPAGKGRRTVPPAPKAVRPGPPSPKAAAPVPRPAGPPSRPAVPPPPSDAAQSEKQPQRVAGPPMPAKTPRAAPPQSAGAGPIRPTKRPPRLEPKRPSRSERVTRPPSYAPPPKAVKPAVPAASLEGGETPREVGKPGQERQDPGAGVQRDMTQEIALDDLQMVEETQDRREVTQEIDLEMLEMVENENSRAAAEKLEKQATDAERQSANQLIRHAGGLDGVDPRLVRAAHSLESDRISGRSKQAAEILRQRAEDLDGINPRFLRAAARLEEAKVSGVEGEDEDEEEEIDEADVEELTPTPEVLEEAKRVESNDDWRSDFEEPSSNSVISFLAPPVVDRPADVRGFPKNQKRTSSPRTAPSPPPARRRTPKPGPPRR